MIALLRGPAPERGIQFRLARALLLAFLPAMVISLCWAWRENDAVHRGQMMAAEQGAAMLAKRFDTSLRTTYFAGTIVAGAISLDSLSSASCDKAALVDPPADFAIVQSGKVLCEKAQSRSLTEPEIETPIVMQSEGASVTIWNGGIRIGLARSDSSLILSWSPEEVGGAGELANIGPYRQTILDAKGGLVFERCYPQACEKGQSAPGRYDFTGGVQPIGNTTLFLNVARASASFKTMTSRDFWQLTLEITAIAFGTISASVVLIDRTVGSWVNYMRRVAVTHAKGRSSVRARHLERAPTEIAELGGAINEMAESIAVRARAMEMAIVERDQLLHELEYRVKINFEIVGGIVDLSKSALDKNRKKSIRMLENYVVTMSVIYGCFFDKTAQNVVFPVVVTRKIIASLANSAGISSDCLSIVCGPNQSDIALDKALALGLCLTYLLPPYLEARSIGAAKLAIRVHLDSDSGASPHDALVVEIDDIAPIEQKDTAFQQRLAASYVAQLRAEVTLPEGDKGLFRLSVPLN